MWAHSSRANRKPAVSELERNWARSRGSVLSRLPPLPHMFHGETVCLRLARLGRDKLQSSITPSSVTQTEHLGFSTGCYFSLISPLPQPHPYNLLLLPAGRNLSTKGMAGKAGLGC